MQDKLIQACEDFSMGRFNKAFPRLGTGLRWHLMGDAIIHGIDEVKSHIKNTYDYSPARFEVNETTVSDNRVIIEGKSSGEESFYFCDVFTINNGVITEIRSYPV